MSTEGRRQVRFHYKGMLEDGSVFFDSTQGDPFEITTGTYAVMAPLDTALSQMALGEERIVEVGQAYGDYDPSAVRTKILRTMVKDGEKLEAGQEIMWESKEAKTPIPARILNADEFTFDLDLNHPLAGKQLTYWVKLIDVLD